MLRVIPFILAVVLYIYALIDCVQTPRSSTRGLHKPLWIPILILLPVVGSILWLTLGRPIQNPPKNIPLHHSKAPDDDPDFLNQLKIHKKKQDPTERQTPEED